MENHRPSSRSFWIELDARHLGLFCSPFEHLAGHGWHEVSSWGAFDLERIIEEKKDVFVHSSQCQTHEKDQASEWQWNKLHFRPSNDLFVSLDLLLGRELVHLSVWAAKPDHARSELRAWCDKYRVPRKEKRSPAEFYLITIRCQGPETMPVEIVKTFPRGESELALHYGDDFPGWASQFRKRLRKHRFGATILRGEPGTGKTSFLRYLIYTLRRTHRFYYLPNDCHELITDPKMAEFWAQENYKIGSLKKVIILEDAESLLMQRGNDNRASLSNMLNVADGLLGEFLKLHLICTINCEVEKLDPAVTRSGRLLAYRHFRRLTAQEAHRLAAAKGLSIPTQEDYSLAEIYNGRNRGPDAGRNKSIGFTSI